MALQPPSPPLAAASETDSSPSGLPTPRRALLHTPGELAHLPAPFALSLSLSIVPAPLTATGRRQSSPPAQLRRPFGPLRRLPWLLSTPSS